MREKRSMYGIRRGRSFIPGVLIGYTKDECYFIEAVICGGENAIRKPGRFQYDSDYAEREIEKVLEEHNFRIQMLGLWYKHNHTNEPAFSTQDMSMHKQLLSITDIGISCLFQKREDGKKETIV